MKTTILAALLCVLVAAPARADDGVDRTLDLYKRFTYRNVTSTEADSIFSAMKISSTFNPKNKMKNLDPEWIPGWDSLSLTDETKTAILQAAINRTWTVQVHADYKAYRAAWAEIEKQLRPELEAAKTGTYYARATALAKLIVDVRKKAESVKALYPDGTAPATVGFVNDVVHEMISLHRETRHEFLIGQYLGKLGIALADFQKSGRPFADDATEQEVFTAFSQAKGNLVTAALPMMAEYGHAYAAVKWPTAKSALHAADKLVEPMQLTANLDRVPMLFAGESGNPADEKLRWIDAPQGGTDHYSPLVVTKVAGAAATLETRYDESVPYGCKRTNQLDSNGNWVQDCNYKHVITKHVLEVGFPELPDGVTLQKGDVVALYGDLESKKAAKGSVTYKITARALARLERAGKPVYAE